MILEIIQGNNPLLYNTISQPYYYSYLYTQARKNDQSKSAKEIVVENLETLNDKITDFFSNQNSTQS